MRIFATDTIKEIQGNKYTFSKLKINDHCQFDEFVAELEKNPQYYSEYKTLLAYMNLYAQGQNLPITKYNTVINGKLEKKNAICNEFKSKHLRIYVFHQNNGKIVILGGYKNAQTKDISKLITIVLDYIENI